MTSVSKAQHDGEPNTSLSRMDLWVERLATPIAAGAAIVCARLPDDPGMPRLFGQSPLRMAAGAFFLFVVARACVAAFRYALGSDDVAVADLVAWKLLTWGLVALTLYALLSTLLGQ